MAGDGVASVTTDTDRCCCSVTPGSIAEQCNVEDKTKETGIRAIRGKCPMFMVGKSKPERLVCVVVILGWNVSPAVQVTGDK